MPPEGHRPTPPWTTRVAARLVRATTVVDRAAQRFSQLRSVLVLALASESFMRSYGEVAFNAGSAYRADSRSFRQGLFDWEEAAVRRFFPEPPAHILVGGAGGGREPFALAKMGYTVTAFDPAAELVSTMIDRAQTEQVAGLHAFCGGYEDLPALPARGAIAGGDLRTSAPFDAAILGWCSLSHLANDQQRVAALAAMADLTRGPLLVSYFSTRAGAPPGAPSTGLRGYLRRRAARWGHAMFTPMIGFARLLDSDEVRGMAGRAGLGVVHIEPDANFPYAVLARAAIGT